MDVQTTFARLPTRFTITKPQFSPWATQNTSSTNPHQHSSLYKERYEK